MTGNKDHLDDFEECKGGSVTFGEGKEDGSCSQKRRHVGSKTDIRRMRMLKNTPNSREEFTKEVIEQLTTLAKFLYSKNQDPTTARKRKVKTGLSRKSIPDEVLKKKSQSKRTKKQNREEQASLAEIVRLQAQEEAENARKSELERQDALIAKRVQDELELPETQKNRMTQVQEAAKYYTEEDWDSVRAKLKANKDLSSKVLSIDFSSDILLSRWWS
ncbi:hypothetical protein Tco_0132660 [Tanacetum coccineum]